jgi:hypothetical protein
MPKITLHEYCVKSVRRNHFPTDMLRYNSCWPKDGESVNKITVAYTRGSTKGMSVEEMEEDSRYWNAIISVNIVSTMAPTEGRWLSFGWSVSNHTTTKIDQ